MIIEYEKRTEATYDEKIQSLADSVQRALNVLVETARVDAVEEDAEKALTDSARASAAASVAQQSAASASSAAASAQADAATARAAADTASDAVETLTGSVNSLTTRVAAAEGDITNVESDISGLGTRVTTAEGKLTSAEGKIETLETSVETATDLLDDMQNAAQQAGTTLTQIYQDATEASTAASSANLSANSALAGLSIVEDVVGALEWLAEHRTLSTDTTVVDKKIYFTYNEETGAISRVSPDGTENPSAEGWYEMSDAMGDYVSTHLSLTSTGLWIVKDGTSAQLQLNENGMSVYPAGSNIPIATYGTNATIGDANGFHITITADYNDSHEGRLSFYRDGTNEVAYISGDSLYINKSVVVQQMNVGLTQGAVDTSTGEIGHGQWSWKVHQNANGLNNLYLKWLG